MATHRFNYPNDPTQGGTWFADTGRRICDWSWDPSTKTLKVTSYGRGKHMNLIGIGEELLTPEGLRERLPQMALEAVQRRKK